MENGYSYLVNLLLAVDQCFNALLAGSCDETLSSRTYRMAQIKAGNWKRFETLVNALFYRDIDSQGRRHCELSYLVEMQHGHLPKAMVRSILLDAPPPAH